MLVKMFVPFFYMWVMMNKSNLLGNFAHLGFIRDAGRVLTISDGIAVISGLTNVKAGEMV